MEENKIIFPAPLKYGDTIAICSPAGSIDSKKIDGAVRVLEDEGWMVRVMPHASGSYGNYAAKDEDRLDDLRSALADKYIRAIICSRGGYGVVHIMEELENEDLRRDPKWLVGFSDISALHALWSKQGVASVHASMCRQIMLGARNEDNASLFGILRGETPTYNFPSCPLYDRPGTATGRLVGGNLAVLSGLLGTRFDIFAPDTILFIEDVAEPIYKIERMLYQLRFAGVLGRLAGLVVGQFTEYKADKSYSKMEQMISDMVAPYSYPVAFGAPIGHVDHNIPLIENSTVTLKVTPTRTNSLIFWPRG